MNVTITPKKLKGEVVIPPSKSLSHRAIIAAGLAQGKSKISNVMYSQDILATIEAMKAIGAKIEQHTDYLLIEGSEVQRCSQVIDANESGSTLRFMIPIALVCKEPLCWIGKGQLPYRPLDSYLEIFQKQKISYEKPEDAYLPLKTDGGLQPGVFEIRGDISSQFITGLLYALPLLKQDSTLIITTPLESKGYVDLTLDILKKYGICIHNDEYRRFDIPGNQTYHAYDYTIEGDYSQSAFFLVADCLGAEIRLKAMNSDSYQADRKILEDLKQFQANLRMNGDEIFCLPGETKGATIDFSQSPDLGPALTVLAALSQGESHFINAKRLRIKECDRIHCMVEELNKLGGNLKELEEGMEILGVPSLRGAIVSSHHDHRIAMALAMASLKMEEKLTILNAECVQKSFPHFWEVFEQLGGEILYEE